MNTVRETPAQALSRSLIRDRRSVDRMLGPFLVISFGLTWGLVGLLFAFYDQITAIQYGETNDPHRWNMVIDADGAATASAAAE